MSKQAFKSLVSVSEQTGFPTHFAADLHVHDQARLLSADAPKTFGWVLRESGTLLLDSRMGAEARGGYREHVSRTDRRECDRFYFWDGSRLREVSCDTMFLLMAAEHHSNTVDKSTENRVYAMY